ncbi:Nif3-like dinuclear metal center hexameric protein [Mesohalobacter halotolerans]|jgi:dinuclear metal center YbgI/SA1388 family protein|uniref:GTP cyclohydrolase 1 type 2 homolog n=1 Tax=Mesohalobacter halotolerans TaxID=1883405 RepID=A0A4U5TPJ3_9FLAO|nr:Nif3-like dinuclear metal center hexameric protein [Mesohalobacter halotolerans]MBS3738512.1 Nif3-like dinuclear metal center hexameric protein [Psychroflexus sp.]NBC58878.1 Nif3-like dinuclear metal center hexameric protein [Bacteroidota bacterium]TKS55896.1 Nif3-like dinuclear metal center hexameric protein [Mesohalobacter halotolerans]
MKIKELIYHLKNYAPLAYAEDFDNVGLIVGDENQSIKGALISLDTTEDVVQEAIEHNCNLIVSFHPIIFSGIKKLNPDNYVNRAVIKAIKNDISIYAIHTALDNAFHGVNRVICNKLGLKNTSILMPQAGTIKKLTTYVPKDNANQLREKLFKIGAGNIGNYSNCSFNLQGQGSFKGNEDSNPAVGQKGQTHLEDEIQINITYAKHIHNQVLTQLFKHHPYEEVAYEIETLENTNQHIGLGMLGQFEAPLNERDFLKLLKNKFKTPTIRHSAFLKKPIQKVAVLGGSGASAIAKAKASGADAFVSADFKYHDFFKAEQKILMVDIGHYESEQFTKELLYTFINENFTNFAIVLSNTNTNPVQYY